MAKDKKQTVAPVGDVRSVVFLINPAKELFQWHKSQQVMESSEDWVWKRTSVLMSCCVRVWLTYFNVATAVAPQTHNCLHSFKAKITLYVVVMKKNSFSLDKSEQINQRARSRNNLLSPQFLLYRNNFTIKLKENVSSSKQCLFQSRHLMLVDLYTFD